LKMVEAQIEALKPFPIHPKRTEYETELVEERDALTNTRNKFQAKVKEFR
jgi:coenzyme F420-reducing hydrogenase delta subunit